MPVPLRITQRPLKKIQRAKEHIIRGWTILNTYDYQGALDDYIALTKMYPKSENAIYNKGITRLKLHDNKGALKDFDEVVKLSPDHKFVYKDSGVCLQLLKKHKEAIKDFTKRKQLGGLLLSWKFRRCFIGFNRSDERL